ncbi:DUF1294 domain-containing protein [Bacteroides fragilis]|nr:DUF1294 domain-containing protein [Bacteroides fragilis]MCS3292664.1 DUF1294 domain-containing protein [Bacteroides fragilis]
MYGIDKRHASRKRWRTPEVRLQGNSRSRFVRCTGGDVYLSA